MGTGNSLPTNEATPAAFSYMAIYTVYPKERQIMT